MRDIGYRTWGLTPADTDPTTGELLAPRPAMMVVTAVDQGASLVFELRQAPESLLVQVEVTALSAEGRPHPSVRVFSGQSAGKYRELDVDDWERKPADELYVVYSTTVRGAQTHLKLVFTGPTLIVNRVAFSAP